MILSACISNQKLPSQNISNQIQSQNAIATIHFYTLSLFGSDEQTPEKNLHPYDKPENEALIKQEIANSKIFKHSLVDYVDYRTGAHGLDIECMISYSTNAHEVDIIIPIPSREKYEMTWRIRDQKGNVQKITSKYEFQRYLFFLGWPVALGQYLFRSESAEKTALRVMTQDILRQYSMASASNNSYQ